MTSKKIVYIVVGILVAAVVAFFALKNYTKSHSPFAEAKSKNGKVKIEYCQPSKKGREVFGKLIPYGKVWRTGANEATKITFEADAKIGDKTIPKGVYSLYSIPEKDSWTILINENADQWGTQHDPEKDLFKLPAKVKELETVVEMLTIGFEETENGTELQIKWDNTQVSLQIGF
ncbi:MAG: DUF2911 domain-containing protein [Bacteroidetes bacterium]|nr:MAG: DUF2911 domain-containing protein [Bacteroidota bacterium]